MDVDTEIETSEQRMEEIIIEPFMEDEIDFDYEFDAPRFYDFTEIELDWEAREADRWFDTAGGYLPSRKYFLFGHNLCLEMIIRNKNFRLFLISIMVMLIARNVLDQLHFFYKMYFRKYDSKSN